MKVWKFQVIHRDYDKPKYDVVDTYLIKSGNYWTALRKLGWQICLEKPKRCHLILKNARLIIRLISVKKADNLWKIGKNGERIYAYLKKYKDVEKLKSKR
jgi:hypothetical protein